MAETRQLEMNGDESFWESNIMGGGRFQAVHLFIEHAVERLQNYISCLVKKAYATLLLALQNYEC